MSNTSTTSSLERKLQDGYQELQTRIPFRVPYNIIQDNITVNATTSLQHFYPEHGYDGVYDITVNPINDGNLIPENIVDGVTIFDVTGTAKNTVKLQANKSVNPGLYPKTVEPNTGFDGLKVVTVNGLLDTEPSLKPENIREGVSILGIVGTYDGSGTTYNGQTDMYVGDGNHQGIQVGDLQVYDSNLIASNIKNGVTIFNVTGNYTGESPTIVPLTNYTIPYNESYNTDNCTINKPSGSDGMSYAQMKLDDSLKQYIQSGVKILGVTGEYSGGQFPYSTSDIYNNGRFLVNYTGFTNSDYMHIYEQNNILDINYNNSQGASIDNSYVSINDLHLPSSEYTRVKVHFTSKPTKNNIVMYIGYNPAQNPIPSTARVLNTTEDTQYYTIPDVSDFVDKSFDLIFRDSIGNIYSCQFSIDYIGFTKWE